jgi:ABC-2 type transport system ATP-binding protein
MMEPILELEGVSRRFGGFSVENVSFALPRGTIMGFVGPNGAGKTTTLKIILGLVRKDAGEVRVFGLDHRVHGRAIRDRLGVVWDENVFYEDFSPRQMGRFLARFYSAWDEAEFSRRLARFEVPPDRAMQNLSRGMKAKVALAAALSHGAELIVMDEPTAGLDPVFRAEMLDLLTEIIADERRSVLFSTHITSDLEKVADYVTFIDRGRIVFSKVKDELLDSYALVRGGAERLAAARPHLLGVREHDHGFEGLCADRGALRTLAGPALVVERASIDDIIVYTTRDARDARAR